MTDHPPGQRVVLTEYGENPMDAVEHHLELETQPFPEPSEWGDHDVVIAVSHAAVGWVDLLMSSGQYQHMLKPPYTPGLEYSGRVAAAGDAVTHVSVGDEVMADGFYTGPRSKGKHQRWGGFARYAVAPGKAAIALPEPFTLEQGCNFLGNYETAYHCLVTRGKVQPDETVLIHGATGSTGLAAVHLAKVLGARVIATSRSPEKLAVVKEQGADHVICTAGENGEMRRFRDDVKALTDGRGADVVYDGVGGDISLESLRCLRFGARYLIVGWAATPDVARGKGKRGAPRANVLPTNLIMMKGLDVLGCPTVISTHHDPSLREERLSQLLEWVDAGRLSPFVSHRFPLSEFREALRAKWKSDFVGGCVLTCDG